MAIFFTGSPTGRIAVQNQPDTCFALFKEKRMKFKNGIVIVKNFSSVQTEKLVTPFKKKESVAIDGQPSLSGKSVEGRRRNSEI